MKKKGDLPLFNHKNSKEIVVHGGTEEKMDDKNTKEVERRLKLLFKPHKTIRDAVHSDVMLTYLEVKILDTKDFQRLRGIRQLGTAHLVYPGANHSRFEHAIGTLFMTEKIIGIVNNNPYPDVFVEPYDRLLLRLGALLHDLAHVPFGHTLEDEANLFESQWKDEERIKLYLGEESEIAKILNDFKIDDVAILKQLCELGRLEFAPNTILKNLKDILVNMENKKVEELPKPYLCDIIGNTLCADLLDYVRRDIYFAGLREAYDERFLSYLYITHYSSNPKKTPYKPRLVLRLVKPATGKLRRDVLSELLHLLRLRYSLAEKVHYHHAKISSSAMIISAVADTLQDKENNLKEDDYEKFVEELYLMSDDTLIEFTKKNGTEGAKYLMENLAQRRLYKPVYGLRYGGEEEAVVNSKKELISELRHKELRWKSEKALETMSELPSGRIVVYCPKEDMGRKAVEVLVNTGDKIGPLDKIAPKRVKEEIESSITKKHLELWHMYVFVDPSLSDDIKGNVLRDCEELFELQNEIEECSEKYKKKDLSYLRRYEEKYMREHPTAKPLINIADIAARLIDPPTSEKEVKYRVYSYEEYCKLRESL